MADSGDIRTSNQLAERSGIGSNDTRSDQLDRRLDFSTTFSKEASKGRWITIGVIAFGFSIVAFSTHHDLLVNRSIGQSIRESQINLENDRSATELRKYVDDQLKQRDTKITILDHQVQKLIKQFAAATQSN